MDVYETLVYAFKQVKQVEGQKGRDLCSFFIGVLISYANGDEEVMDAVDLIVETINEEQRKYSDDYLH